MKSSSLIRGAIWAAVFTIGFAAACGGSSACDVDACHLRGHTCCYDGCEDLYTDIKNCGGCTIVCPGMHPFCNKGVCGAPPCDNPSMNCTNGFCCGTTCCSQDELCCNTKDASGLIPTCVKPVNNTCPCPTCNG